MSRAALSVQPRAARRARLRDEVFARDGGVCQICRRDVGALLRDLTDQREKSHGHMGRSVKYRERLRELGIKSLDRLFDIDHVQPLSEGGADTAINMRVLCAFGPPGSPGCHARVTRELAARRARRPQIRRGA